MPEYGPYMQDLQKMNHSSKLILSLLLTFLIRLLNHTVSHLSINTLVLIYSMNFDNWTSIWGPLFNFWGIRRTVFKNRFVIIDISYKDHYDCCGSMFGTGVYWGRPRVQTALSIVCSCYIQFILVSVQFNDACKNKCRCFVNSKNVVYPIVYVINYWIIKE